MEARVETEKEDTEDVIRERKKAVRLVILRRLSVEVMVRFILLILLRE